MLLTVIVHANFCAVLTTAGCILGTVLGEVIETPIYNAYCVAHPDDAGYTGSVGRTIWMYVFIAAIVIGLICDLIHLNIEVRREQEMLSQDSEETKE